MFNNLLNIWQNTPGGHTGSWLGLKDRGVTEQVGALFGAPQTSQGGSNLSSLFNSPSNNSGSVASWNNNTAISQLGQQVGSAAKGLQQTPAGSGGNGLPTNTNSTNVTTGVTNPTDGSSNLRNEISSGWDNYINSLNAQLEGLNTQRTAQEGVAQSTYDQNLNNLNLSNQQGLQQLGTQRSEAESNQKKTLKDLAGNIRSSFDAGNVYLGSRGAGDSSAANQYAYALTKMGTQQRSDVMNQTAKIMDEINGRETNLKNIYDTESKNLKLQYDSQIQSIAQWFADAQSQLRQAQAQGQLNKSQDLANLSKEILNQAMTQVNQLNQEISNRRSSLEQWAMGISKNIGEFKSNMGQIAQYSPELPGFSPVIGTPSVDSSGNMFVPRGYGSGADEQKQRLFR